VVKLIDIKQVEDLRQKVMNEVSRVIVGKEDIKQALMIALIAGGHVLIEGAPGTAKTQLAKTFARAIGGTFKRIQFTPDMLPADVTGFYLYSPTGPSNFIEGPIFANVILADELNRTTPRTQSALLEAMQEHQVTIEKQTYDLQTPFMVIATQVMAGGEGTYPLTDVQTDRFLLRVNSSYPSVEEEMLVISGIDRIEDSNVAEVTTPKEIIKAREVAKQVYVSPEIARYIVTIIDTLRADPDVLSGPSTRASISLFKCSRTFALFEGRDYVIPDDVKRLAFPTIEHRIRVKPEAEMDEITPTIILQRTLDKAPVPKPS
jgi:MoxR-like ATPase